MKKDINATIKNLTTENVLTILTTLEGKKRAEQLGLEYKHYSSKINAKSWYKEVVKKIHPDRCKDERQPQAWEKLELIYMEMTL